MTGYLTKHGYWPSFNVPYFHEVQVKAGYSASDWSDDDRHCLFEKLQGSISDLNSFEKIIRWNDFREDSTGCSQHNPCRGAIACRADLEVVPELFGALDAKWSSATLARTGATHAQAGPTHDNQPIFCWSHHHRVPPHNLQSDCWNFTTVRL